MKEAKNVVVRLEGRAFVFEVDIAEEDLISEMISSLSLFIKRGFPIKVIQTLCAVHGQVPEHVDQNTDEPQGTGGLAG